MEYFSKYLKEQILGGNTILFLGAGASIGSSSTDKKFIGFSGNQLKDAICDEFLSGKSKNKNLSYVGALAIDLAGVAPVHKFIEKHTKELEPTEGHNLISKFKWKAIVTTNYDFLVEKSYERNISSSQRLKRIISDKDDIQEIIIDNNNLPFLKLHGCISKLNDPELPLILSSYDYYKFRVNRTSLFTTLKEWAYSHTLVFCGYSISDENIRDLIFDVSEIKNQRPRYILVDPSLEEQDMTYWRSNRFDCVPLTFNDFMKELDREIPDSSIRLSSALPISTCSITKLIPSHNKPSEQLINYINDELKHIHAGISTEKTEAKKFFKGSSDGFGWVVDEYDISRRITGTLIEDTIFESLNSSSNNLLFYLIKGYAGSGKSVVLKRFSWEAAISYNANVFYLCKGSILDNELIFELVDLIKDRVYIVIDNALEYGSKLRSLVLDLKKKQVPVTIVSSARTNEWNMQSDDFESYVTANYDLLDLNNNEIRELLKKLTENKCLGYLETLPIDERFTYLQDKLKSQLLVALHEATEGKTFLEIISDEYDSIYPLEAKIIYLDVCTLDRFDVGVRAGLLSRISGVDFNSFFKTLMTPLENIINVYYDHRVGDYVYRSRHQHIAAIVFDKALVTAEEKSQQIIRIIRYLNNSFETDRKAISQLIKGKLLADEFTNKSLAYSIFNAAEESGIHPSVIFHQKSVFELHHPGGDLRAALVFINKAEESPGSISLRTLSHTKSNIFRRLAAVSSVDMEKSRLRQDALTILNKSIHNSRDSLPFFTKGQILLEELKDKVITNSGSEELNNEVVNDISRQMELNLTKGLQLFPSDEKLLTLEADFSNFLDDTPRALEALEKSFRKNKDSIFTAIRLARYYFKYEERRGEAITIVRTILINHPTSKESHYELARMLIQTDELKHKDEILQHLKRSFSSGDTHYDARYLYARHEYLYGDVNKSKNEFKALSKLGLPLSLLNKVRGEVKDNCGKKITYQGTVVSIHESFGFIKCHQFEENIYIHYRSMSDVNEWQFLKKDVMVFFQVGFSFKGIAGIRVTAKI
ncbi:Uncharacterised protein [Yersinia enterocolitica]|uniref:SIR2 family NAD-dependent protein deacylase n=1 Tax=Yersinia mollaretii TaxID=33060 RepID=UPI0005E5B6FC|nr:SIR2 family protein [Yersinia mollaretii]CNK21931.1 Uncharacterised protein [Yersinia enterocolitica]